ncbi:putative lipo domain protein, partial [Bacteroides fragilis str. 20793-3]
MKNKPILKLNRLVMIIPAVLVLLSLSSCQQEELYSNRTPPGSTLVNLSVSASNSDV